jgi:hypothetical protein
MTTQILVLEHMDDLVYQQNAATPAKVLYRILDAVTCVTDNSIEPM